MKLLSILASAALLLVAQAHAQQTNASGDTLKPAERAALNKALESIQTTTETVHHILAAGDVIDVKVFQEDDLNTHARIDADGTISIPLLGLVKLAGKNVDQAQELIHDLLALDYLQKPEVSLTVVEFAKKRFSILGEVKNPGFYTFPEDDQLDVLQAIAMAGGYTPFSKSRNVCIKRTVGGHETILHANAKSMATREQTELLRIEPNDVIFVDTSLF